MERISSFIPTQEKTISSAVKWTSISKSRIGANEYDPHIYEIIQEVKSR